MPHNLQIHLVSRPKGEPLAENFLALTLDTPTLQDNQVLVKHEYLSLDPYMRGRMNDVKSYTLPQPLNSVMIGGTVGEVVESRHAGFAAGDKVVGMGGWQTYSVVDANTPGALRKIDTTHVPISHYLGAVGMPGVTAWHGLVRIIEPKAGQTLTVSAASGAVGSAFGALAKARGCRVIGIAGGKDKCDYVTNELGFDACIDYKQHTDSFKDRPRAVSCSFILNDEYEGGEFAFFNREAVYKLKKGSCIMFPSNFMYPHEIMPVTHGTRYSIVTWFV